MKRILVGLIVLMPFITGCHSPIYTIEPFEAWAVDAETGEPIEGANVVATWALFDAWYLHSSAFLEMPEVKEAVTDKNGRFSFPGFKLYNPKLRELREDPKLIIFKPGYEYVRRSNGCGMGAEGDCRWATRIAVVAGKKVKMKKIDYTLTSKDASQRTAMNRDLYTGLSTQMDYVLESCKFKNIPLFYKSIEAESIRLAGEGFSGDNSLPSIQRLDRQASRCGFGKEALEGQLK